MGRKLRRDEINFRPLEKSDFPSLHEWIGHPHMVWWSAVLLTLEQIQAHYTPYIEGTVPTFAYISLVDDLPAGYIHSYRNIDHPEYVKEINLHDGVSIDFFISEKFLGRGLGRKILAAYVEKVIPQLFPDESRIYICHHKNNLKANACSQAVGFEYLRDVVEKGQEMNLYVYSSAGLKSPAAA